MVLYKAERQSTIAQAVRRRDASSFRTAALASLGMRFLTYRVTFLKTLVSDYQILLPMQSFACTLGQRSSQDNPMTIPGRLLRAFLPNSSLSTADVDLF